MCGSKETMCASCSHIEVCSLKNEFLEAQKTVDNVYINRPCDDGNKVNMIHLRDIKFIKPVELSCIHYKKKEGVTLR